MFLDIRNDIRLNEVILTFWFGERVNSLGRLITCPGSPRRRKGSRALKEIGVWNSQGGK